MSHRQPLSLRALPIAFLIFAVLPSVTALYAKDPPSDVCALLPAAELEKVLQETYGSPKQSTAPPPFRGSPSGTQCEYRTGKGLPRKVIFIAYVDPSPETAKDNFTKLSAFFGPNTPVADIGDSAYLDSNHAIHVLKGKLRYYINVLPIGAYTAKEEKQLNDLAAWVAGQL